MENKGIIIEKNRYIAKLENASETFQSKTHFAIQDRNTRFFYLVLQYLNFIYKTI